MDNLATVHANLSFMRVNLKKTLDKGFPKIDTIPNYTQAQQRNANLSSGSS